MGGEAVCDYFALGFGSYGKTIGKRLSEELDTLIMTGICCGWLWRRAESMGGSLGRRKCAGTFSTVPMCIGGCVTAREWGVCPGQGGLRSWLGSLHHREAPCGLRAAGTGGFLDQQRRRIKTAALITITTWDGNRITPASTIYASTAETWG